MTDTELKDLMKDIGNVIKNRRISLGLSRAALSISLKIRKTTIGNWEDGIRFPKLKYWKDLLSVLECKTLDDIFNPVLEGINNEYDPEYVKLCNDAKKIFRSTNKKKQLKDYIEFLLSKNPPESNGEARGSPKLGSMS